MSSVDAFVLEGLQQFDEGFSCAEVVLMMGMKRMGLRSELVPRVATGFAAGLCRTKSQCGVIVAGVMALGVAFGRDKKEDDRSVLYAKAQSMVNGLRGRFGSDNCYALTGLDFNQPDAAAIYNARVRAQCHDYIEYVLRYLFDALPPS